MVLGVGGGGGGAGECRNGGLAGAGGAEELRGLVRGGARSRVVGAGVPIVSFDLGRAQLPRRPKPGAQTAVEVTV